MSETSTSSASTPAQSTTPQSEEFRTPRPVVVAGIELPEEEMWRWWLRIKKFDLKMPVDRGIRLLAVLDIGKFVRRYGLRFTVFGEGSEPLRYILVTQSKWFHAGYLGMPEEQIPYYPGPGECEERARAFLQKCKVQGAAELSYRTLLVGEDPSLYDTSSATLTTRQHSEFRIFRPVVVAGIELTEQEMWWLWLRIKKFDMSTPVDRGLRLLAVLNIGNFVRRYGFRFTVFGEDFEPLRYILVTQSKWFHEGYLGMPEEQIPLYQPGKCVGGREAPSRSVIAPGA